MSVNLLPEDDLRAALRPYRAAPASFAKRVHERIEAAAETQATSPLARLSPWMRGVAALVPLEVLAGCQAAPPLAPLATPLAPASGLSKLLAYLTFPAISVFILVGATVTSAWRIHQIRAAPQVPLSDPQAYQLALQSWWTRHLFAFVGVTFATLSLAWWGSAWLVFAFYLLSFGALTLVLSRLAKLGLGTRHVIGQACSHGLFLLGISASSLQRRDTGLHFIDQHLLWTIFFSGNLIVLMLSAFGMPLPPRHERTSVHFRRAALLLVLAPLVVGFVGIIAWDYRDLFQPPTPSNTQQYVESFDAPRYGSLSWRQWEIAVHGARDAGLELRLDRPRQRFLAEMAGRRDGFVLGSGLRAGLVSADELASWPEYGVMRRVLLQSRPPGYSGSIPFSEPYDWVIRTAASRQELSPEERDVLEQRLLAAWNQMLRDSSAKLETALRVTQLLDVIGRPLDRAARRSQVHAWLREFHCQQRGGFSPAGGFRRFSHIAVPDLEATAAAIGLMEIYGVPDGLDLLWVRAYLSPWTNLLSSSPDAKWARAALFARLERLPGARKPTWLEVAYYERTLLAALALVGLCIYATLQFPASPAAAPLAERSANEFPMGNSPSGSAV